MLEPCTDLLALTYVLLANATATQFAARRRSDTIQFSALRVHVGSLGRIGRSPQTNAFEAVKGSRGSINQRGYLVPTLCYVEDLRAVTNLARRSRGLGDERIALNADNGYAAARPERRQKLSRSRPSQPEGGHYALFEMWPRELRRAQILCGLWLTARHHLS